MNDSGEDYRFAIDARPVSVGGNFMNRVWSEYSQNDNEVACRPSFEETYPRYEFAEMVRIGLVLAKWLAASAGWPSKVSRRGRGAHFGMFGKPSAAEMPPAE